MSIKESHSECIQCCLTIRNNSNKFGLSISFMGENRMMLKAVRILIEIKGFNWCHEVTLKILYM